MESQGKKERHTMSEKHLKEKKVSGFNILENECIWMKSGLVSFKRCENAYDCNSCQFDKAMTAAIQAKKNVEETRQSFREAAKANSFMERQCRHMLSGRVAVKRCANDFRCDVCEFDQFLEDEDARHALGKVPIVQVDGFLYSDSYYYHQGHTWARVEYGGRVRVGVDDFAMKLLGRPNGWNLPHLGNRVSPEVPGFSLKRDANDARVFAPLEGIVVAVNREVLEKPALPHHDPYQSGWLFLLEPLKLKKGLEGLAFGEQGHAWLHHEFETLQQLIMPGHGAMAATGAPLVDDIFAAAPEVGWKKLVKTFLHTD